MSKICDEWKTDLSGWLKMLNDVEIKALGLSMKSFDSGVHADIVSSQEQRVAYGLFTDAVNNLRSAMIRELE